jgi:DNA polymerase III subunit epsilon
MRTLFFDTETTGLLLDKEPDDYSEQPRLVQIAALLFSSDEHEAGSIDLVVNPGIDIPMEASKVHGITTEHAQFVGVPERAAVWTFARLLTLADIIVAHNVEFDRRVLRIAAQRGQIGLPKAKVFRCTMDASAPIVGLPPTPRMVAAGFLRPKPPKLEEAYHYFFGETFTPHRAIEDVRACARIYFELVKRGAWKEAA